MTAIACGGLAVATPIAVGLRAFFSPMSQKSELGEPMKLTTLDVLTDKPTRITVTADQNDAWNRIPNAPLGTIYLRKKEDGTVEALQACCPHAGCTIGLQETAEGTRFNCPCHIAYFSLDGVRLQESSPSPRDMDTLEVEIRNENEVWVKYQNFLTGTAKKTASA